MLSTVAARFAPLALVLFALPALAQDDRPAPGCDGSPEAVARDEASLRETIREALVFLVEGSDGDAARPGERHWPRRRGNRKRELLEKLASSIEVGYVGPGELVPIPRADDLANRPGRDDPPRPQDVPARIDEWVGVNPVTCNQFKMKIQPQAARILRRLGRQQDIGAAKVGDDVFTKIPPWDWHPPEDEQFGPPKQGPYFSQCNDTRLRNGTFDWPTRTVANLSSDGQASSCTGTLLGPRHLLTAGHCVYGGGNTWHDFYVTPGRDGPFQPFGSVRMSDTEGLNMGFRWYWIPAAAVGPYPSGAWFSGLDVAILILPQRLGDVAGWMGTAARSENALTSTFQRNLAYPGQAGFPIGFHPVQLEGALYGDINQCNVGDYSDYDANGWARLAGHSCDNSPGHSGGPIYQWIFGPNAQTSSPAVSLVISHFPAFVNDFDCENNPRPYKATRLTAEYVNQLIFMLSWKP